MTEEQRKSIQICIIKKFLMLTEQQKEIIAGYIANMNEKMRGNE